jgi:hypothetical protein
MSHSLEVLTVHLVPLCCCDYLKILLLVFQEPRLVRDLVGASIVYALDHGNILGVNAIRLLEHF